MGLVSSYPPAPPAQPAARTENSRDLHQCNRLCEVFFCFIIGYWTLGFNAGVKRLAENRKATHDDAYTLRAHADEYRLAKNRTRYKVLTMHPSRIRTSNVWLTLALRSNTTRLVVGDGVAMPMRGRLTKMLEGETLSTAGRFRRMPRGDGTDVAAWNQRCGDRGVGGWVGGGVGVVCGGGGGETKGANHRHTTQNTQESKKPTQSRRTFATARALLTR